jgi:transcriptional regulator with XRE-family HTH domain
MAERKRMTMTEVVGANVRRLRADRGWSQDLLRGLLEDFGVKLSRPTIAQLENGKRPLPVDELLALGLALGIAPHLLLYPPAWSDVAVTDDLALPGPALAAWLWTPDTMPPTAPDVSEQRMYSEAMTELLENEAIATELAKRQAGDIERITDRRPSARTPAPKKPARRRPAGRRTK